VSKPKRHQPAEKPVPVLICADSSFTCAGLERLLEPESSLQVVGAIPHTNSPRAAIAESDPDVVLLRFEVQPQEMRRKELTVLGVPIVWLSERVIS
jgi:chemotaxis response regulator CheB